MKRSIPIIVFAMIALVGTSDLLAQRGRDRDGNRGNRDRWEDSRDRRDRDDRRGFQDFNRRGDRRGDRGYVVRNGRRERVVDRRRIRYDGYGYPTRPRRGYQVVYDYDFRNGRRFRINRAPRPSVRHIWVPGHWRFSHRRGHDVWVRGGWTIRGRNHRWVAGHYARFGGARTWVPGCWSVIY